MESKIVTKASCFGLLAQSYFQKGVRKVKKLAQACENIKRKNKFIRINSGSMDFLGGALLLLICRRFAEAEQSRQITKKYN